LIDVGNKNFYNPCPLLDNFIEFGRKKEEKKESKHILKLLDNNEGGGTHGGSGININDGDGGSSSATPN
jgi:hypothetical protein